MIPSQVGDITAGWLNDKLGEAFGTIAEVRSDPIGEGVGILGEVARLHLEYADGETGPPTVIAKCQSLFGENVALSQSMGFYEREIRFYRELASDLDIRVPICHLAEMEEEGAPFVLILEEVTGARMIDQIQGAGRRECEQVVDTVAKLHTRFWANDALDSLEWLPPMNNDLYKAAQELTEANMPAFAHNWASRVPTETLTWVQTLTPRYPDMLDWFVTQGAATFAHTDCRAENYLFGGSAGDDAVTVLDWQLSTRHIGAYDVANFMGQSVEVQNRRDWEDDILRRYHRTLVERGVPDYPFDRCLRDYRYSLLHQAWAQVAIANIDPGNERGRRLLDAFVTRAFQAASDNNAGELIEEF